MFGWFSVLTPVDGCVCFMPDSREIVKIKDKRLRLIDVVFIKCLFFVAVKTTCPSVSF